MYFSPCGLNNTKYITRNWSVGETNHQAKSQLNLLQSNTSTINVNSKKILFMILFYMTHRNRFIVYVSFYLMWQKPTSSQS